MPLNSKKTKNSSSGKPDLSCFFVYPSGFNGQERDDEIAGVGNFNTALYWEYDTRLGRRWNVDPLGYFRESLSPYNFCSNNPINRTDPNGLLDDDIYVNNNTKQVSVIKTNDNYDRLIVDGTYKGNTEKGIFKNNYKEYKANELKINYSSSANKSTVSDYTTSVIVDLMNKTEENSIQINSTARSVEDQVKLMGDMIESRGMNAQKKMYAQAGDKVLDKYPDRAAMLETAKAIGPSNVSKHCADLNKMNVIDVSPVNGGINNAKKFSWNAQRNPAVSRVLSPWTSTIDPAIHIEVPQIK
jgi:RHS repeat-associated protein